MLMLAAPESLENTGYMSPERGQNPYPKVYDVLQAKFSELIAASLEDESVTVPIESDGSNEWIRLSLDGLPIWISRSQIDVEQEGTNDMETAKVHELWSDSYPIGPESVTTTKPREYLILNTNNGDVFETLNINHRPFSRKLSEIEKQHLRDQIERAGLPEE